MSVFDSAKAWLTHRRATYAPKVKPISWQGCERWRFKNGELSHDSGAYFSIVGITARSNDSVLDGIATPIINQPEIGILAFLLRRGRNGYDWLLQAKAEPGTVEGVQAAPSVQATESNYNRVHGGAPTTFLPLVRAEGDGPGRLADVRQSEQGSMFLNKYNRNVAALIDHDITPSGPWRWSDSAEMRVLLQTDYALNTDARSVITTTPWRFMASTDAAFSSRADQWREALSASYAAPDESAAALTLLGAARERTTLTIERTTLEALPACVQSSGEIASTIRKPALRVRPYAVSAPDREITSWSQPLVLRDEHQSADLVCAVRDGVLQFYFALSPEIGFANKIQLGPSAQSDAYVGKADWIRTALARPDTVVRASVLQSDEGGRFMHCITRYRLCQIAEDTAPDDARGAWIALGDIERLDQIPGVFTNEGRTLVSLILIWA